MRSHHLCLPILAIAIALTATRPALADDEPTTTDEHATSVAPPALSDSPYASERPPPVATESYWYGWQTLIVDGASIGTMAIGGAAPPLALVGFGGYLIGPAFVHGANGNSRGAGLSIALRATLPLLGGLIGYASAGRCTDTDPEHKQFFGPCFLHGFAEAGIGVVVGATLAIVIDTAAIARGERAVESKPGDGRARVTGVAPSYDPKTGTAGLGLGGTF